MRTSFELSNLTNAIDNKQSVTLENASHGLCVNIDTQYSSLSLSLFGGHVLSFIHKKDNKERLWLSRKAIFDGKTPIRGGIPICWPWFSSHANESSYPSHGFARTQMFTLSKVEETLSEREVVSTKLTLVPCKLGLFGYKNLQMKLVVEVSSTLTISIVTNNNSDNAIALTQALHTYLQINDITSTVLKGVTSDYDDKPSSTRGNKAPSPYIFTGEVDRIHTFSHSNFSEQQDIEIFAKEPAQNIAKLMQCGHDSTVVWNPWQEKSVSMKDMDDDGFKTMLCVEAANTQNTEHPLQLEPSQMHTLSQTIY